MPPAMRGRVLDQIRARERSRDVHRRTVAHAYSSSRLRWAATKSEKKLRRTIEGFGGRPYAVEFISVLKKGSGKRRPERVPSCGERLQRQAVIGKASALRIYRV